MKKTDTWVSLYKYPNASISLKLFFKESLQELSLAAIFSYFECNEISLCSRR